MWEILGGLLLGTAVSGVVPLVNAEVLVIVAAAAAPTLAVPLVACVSTVGQMTGKVSLFALARWAPNRLPGRARDALGRGSDMVSDRGGTAGSLVFTSALTGFPPFYGVSLATGALGMRLQDFLVAGGAGRFLRFGVLAWAGSRFGERALDVLTGSTTITALFGG